jgi:hypothetical protein
MDLTTLEGCLGISGIQKHMAFLTAIYIDTSLLRVMQPTKSASCEIYAPFSVIQNSTCGVYTAFLIRKSPNIPEGVI